MVPWPCRPPNTIHICIALQVGMDRQRKKLRATVWRNKRVLEAVLKLDYYAQTAYHEVLKSIPDRPPVEAPASSYQTSSLSRLERMKDKLALQDLEQEHQLMDDRLAALSQRLNQECPELYPATFRALWLLQHSIMKDCDMYDKLEEDLELAKMHGDKSKMKVRTRERAELKEKLREHERTRSALLDTLTSAHKERNAKLKSAAAAPATPQPVTQVTPDRFEVIKERWEAEFDDPDLVMEPLWPKLFGPSSCVPLATDEEAGRR